MQYKIISTVMNNKWVNPYQHLQQVINKTLRKILSPQNNGLIFSKQYELLKKYIMAQPEFITYFNGNYDLVENHLFIKINEKRYEWKQQIQSLDNLAIKLHKKPTCLPHDIIQMFDQSKSREIRYKYPYLCGSGKGSKTKHLEKEPYFSLSFIVRPMATFIDGEGYRQKFNFNFGGNSINIFFHGNLNPKTGGLLPSHESIIRHGYGCNIEKNGLGGYINKALRVDFPSLILHFLASNHSGEFGTILHYISEEVNFAIKEWHRDFLANKPMAPTFTREELFDWKK